MITENFTYKTLRLLIGQFAFCISRSLYTWLLFSECSTSLLWQSIVVFGTELQGILIVDYCVPVSEVASTCDLPDVINCQFREFVAAPLGRVHFLSPDQVSGIHCLMICGILLLTLNNLGQTWRRNCSLDIRSISALQMLRNRRSKQKQPNFCKLSLRQRIHCVRWLNSVQSRSSIAYL